MSEQAKDELMEARLGWIDARLQSLFDRNDALEAEANALRTQLEESQEELRFVNLRKEESLRDNLMRALGHAKDDGHTYEQHELGQFLEDVFYHFRDELPALRTQLAAAEAKARHFAMLWHTRIHNWAEPTFDTCEDETCVEARAILAALSRDTGSEEAASNDD